MNKTNLEIKYFCADMLNIRAALKRLGAKREIVKTQKDYFFNLPIINNRVSGRLKFRIEGKRKTLVYYERPDFVKTKNTTSDVKLYTITDQELFPFLKKALGIKAIVDKKREVWRNGNTVFHIDNVKGVGHIFEIELQKTNTITSRDRKLFAYYQSQLLPFLGKIIKGSNVDLVSKK